MLQQAPKEALAPILYLCGCTASGKSAVAMELARRVGGEIISVDSMQVYRGLDIGTAKPSASERNTIPHHLLDVAALTEAFDAARFQTLAENAVNDILQRGKVPIFCGGTGFYFKAWQKGLPCAPTAPTVLRQELEAMPLEALLTELRDLDPKTFARIDQSNPRRVVRALEIVRLTGKPVPEADDGLKARPVKVFGLDWPNDQLRQRMDARVDRMFAQGLVEETRHLLARGLAENRTAMQAIGYRQVVEHLQGERSLPDTIALVKQKTWQFARRQRTWFRHQLAVNWIPANSASNVSTWADAVEAQSQA